MTREQFDHAVEAGYKRLVRFAELYLAPGDVYEGADVVHNVLLAFRVKRLLTFDWTDQEAWESYIRTRITGDILNAHSDYRAALDFRRADAGNKAEASEFVDPIDKITVSDAFTKTFKGLSEQSRQVVLALLAGFSQEQVGEMLDVTQQRVAIVWKRVLQRARERTELEASGESRSSESTRPA